VVNAEARVHNRVIARLFFIISITLTVEAEARQIAAQSTISAVTVFNDRAMVTRTAKVNLAKGNNLITFENLPVMMIDDSIRADAKGSAQARISGLTLRTVYLDRSNEKRIRELEAEISSVERKIQKVETRKTALGAQRAFIESIKVGWGERISKELSLGKPTTNELTEANRFIGEGIYKIEDQMYDADAELKPLQGTLAALKNQLEQHRGNIKKEAREVDLNLEAPRDMELTVELSYLVNQARWEPAYDIRLAADGKSAELVYRAIVSQSTGEEWQQVAMSLSSAMPSLGISPPELQPWYVGFYNYRPLGEESIGTVRRQKIAMPAAAPMPMQMDAGGASTTDVAQKEQYRISPVTALLTEGQTSVLFNVPKPVDVSADGRQHSSVIALERVPVVAEYLAIPKLSPRVFLKSEVTNMTPYPLLSGEVHVFNDAAYAGKSHVKTVAAGEKFDLYFGVDDQVKLKRKATKIRKEAGLLAGNQISWNCLVELENLKSESISVTLIDQIPLATNEEIRVSIRDPQPKPDEKRTDGTITWKIAVNPGEKRKINYEIDVEYPKGKEVSGTD
jgi:uncharacterized protein (TIGR02231 family)